MHPKVTQYKCKQVFVGFGNLTFKTLCLFGCACQVAQNYTEYDFLPQKHPHMPPNLLDILRRGLAKLTASVGTQRDALKAKLAKREPISMNRPGI